MPIPAALLTAGKIFGAVAPALGEFLGAKNAAFDLKQDPAAIAAQYDELRKSMPKFGVGSAFNEYLAMSKQDPTADMERKIAAEQEATNIGALKAGGAKALIGGLGSVSRQAAENRSGIEGRSAGRQQSALANFAAQQQRVQDANTRMQQGLAQSQFQAERGAEQYNRYLDSQSSQALGSALGAIGGQFGQGHFNGDTKASDYQGTFGADFLSPVGAFGSETGTGAFSQASLLGEGALDQFSNLGGFRTRAQMGLPYFRRNEGGMMTDGAFSHETNPIDIMQDGAKVGEMTGGEAILNPEQQNKVAKQSPYFRKLMREFAMRDRR